MFGLPLALALCFSCIVMFTMSYKLLNQMIDNRLIKGIVAVIAVLVFFYMSIIIDNYVVSRIIIWLPTFIFFTFGIVFLCSKGAYPKCAFKLLNGSFETGHDAYVHIWKEILKYVVVVTIMLVYAVFSFCFSEQIGLRDSQAIAGAKSVFRNSYYGEFFSGDPNFEMHKNKNAVIETDGTGKYMVALEFESSSVFTGNKYISPKTETAYVFFYWNGAEIADYGYWDSVVIDYRDIDSFKQEIGWNSSIKQEDGETSSTDSNSISENIEISSTPIPTSTPAPEATPTTEGSDIQATAPAEWDEMPIHKCVRCGGVARNHSGAWNCDECYYCFGEDEFGDEVVIADFIAGQWGDSWSQRCIMNVIQNDDGTATMKIKWSSGADSTTQWVMTGTLWDYENIIMYTDAVKTISTSEGVTEVYSDGSGFFYLKDGFMYWVDYKEHSGYECVFEFIIEDESIINDVITEESIVNDDVTESATETYTYYHYKWTGQTTIGTPYRVYSPDKNHHAESALAAGFTLNSAEPVYEEYVFDTYNGDSFYTTLTADSSGLEEQWFIKK